jgi:hypothetical protein
MRDPKIDNIIESLPKHFGSLTKVVILLHFQLLVVELHIQSTKDIVESLFQAPLKLLVPILIFTFADLLQYLDSYTMF